MSMRAIPIVTLAALVAACDGDATAPPIRLAAGEVHVATFADGWEGWTARYDRLPSGEASARLRGDLAAYEPACVWLEAANRSDAVRQWVQRPFVIDARDQPVEVRVAFDIGAGLGLESILTAIAFVRIRGEPLEIQRLAPIGSSDYNPQPQHFVFVRALEAGARAAVTVGAGYTSGIEIRQGTCVDNVTVEVVPL